MSTVTVARRDQWKTRAGLGTWHWFVVYNFGDGLIARLFPSRNSADYFVERRVKHAPIYRGRVKFK